MAKKLLTRAKPSALRKGSESGITQAHARTILKPLGTREAATAVKQALEAVLGIGVQRERLRVYGPSLYIEKPSRRDSSPSRIVVVQVRDRDQGVVHRVSLQDGKVIDRSADQNTNPPFSDEEREDARRLISTHADYRRLVARKSVEFEWFSPGAHNGGRVIGARLVRVKNNEVVEELGVAEVELDHLTVHGRRSER